MTDRQESAIKNFTRGGQLFLHNVRMIKQVVLNLLVMSFIIMILFNATWIYLKTSHYQLYLFQQWLHANFLTYINPNTIQRMLQPNGQVYEVHAKDILQASYVIDTIKQLYDLFIQGIIYSLVTCLIATVTVTIWLSYRGRQKGKQQYLRGARLVTPKQLKKMIKRKHMDSELKLAGIPIIKHSERSHFLIHGTTGAGKSNCIKEIIDYVREQGHRAVIYDKGGVYLPYYFRKGKDILLNPLDERTAAWNIWSECQDPADFDTMAAVLIPKPTGNFDPFWIDAARTIFAAAAYRMQDNKQKSILDLLK